jgi:hypothetical protein
LTIWRYGGTLDRMSKNRSPSRGGMAMKKTSMKLPEDLWKKLRIRALEEGRDAQNIVAELIEGYLERSGKKGGPHAR